MPLLASLSNWESRINPKHIIDMRYMRWVLFWLKRLIGKRYNFPDQKDVTFVAGIACSYIRALQTFKLSSIGSL